jgi:hypothetical protein
VGVVVVCPAAGIAQHVVGVGQGLEPGGGQWVFWLGVGVHTLHGAAVGAGNVLLGSAGIHTEHTVGVVMALPGPVVFHAASLRQSLPSS